MNLFREKNCGFKVATVELANIFCVFGTFLLDFLNGNSLIVLMEA